MNIASNAKLLTSVAALGTLGGGFRWRTSVHVDQLDDTTGVVTGDLYIRGRGDPSLSAADLDAVASDVAARGVRSVEGQLVVDSGYFDNVIEPPHFGEQPAEAAAFRAPVASFAVARSAVTITAVGEPSKPATVRIDPDSNGYIRIGKSSVKTATAGRTNISVIGAPKANHLELDVSGVIRLSTGRFEHRRRVDDPTRFAVEVFRKALTTYGIKVKRPGFRAGSIPAGSKLIAWHDSAPLASIIRDMNKFSDNYAAECVLKTLGAEARSTSAPRTPATWADGTTAVAAYLGGIGIRPGSYRCDNGSGLFSSTEVAARQIVTLLRAAYRDFRIWPDLVASLPVGGIDGTLAKRWRGNPTQGRVRAKTGTLDKVTSLAGFIGVDTARPLAFAIVVNDIPSGQRTASRAMADDMVNAMTAYLEPGFPPR
jgi:D-alanyl-D-alanine carboxypeptidase/D-alanyl-D-alanine-endopeptidase (penicillin-binding protein 4)